MPKHPHDVDLVGKMRAAGIRVTAPRRVIARVLEEAEEHLDMDQIADRAREIDAGVHRATVYRTVNMLKKHGLVDELDLLHVRGDRHYYEIKSGGDHAHVICKSCGRVAEPSGDAITTARRSLARETGFDVTYMRIEVSGTCPTCKADRQRSRDG